MSLEERVAALEKGFVAMQQDFLSYRTEATSTNTLGILNKVIASQGIQYREIAENETMLLSMVSSMQSDISTLKADVSTLKEDVGAIQSDLTLFKSEVNRRFTSVDRQLASMEQRFEQRFTSVETKVDQVLQVLTTRLEPEPEQDQ